MLAAESCGPLKIPEYGFQELLVGGALGSGNPELPGDAIRDRVAQARTELGIELRATAKKRLHELELRFGKVCDTVRGRG
jgi:hypothetical protein